jgi:hypothetical protein
VGKSDVAMIEVRGQRKRYRTGTHTLDALKGVVAWPRSPSAPIRARASLASRSGHAALRVVGVIRPTAMPDHGWRPHAGAAAQSTL